MSDVMLFGVLRMPYEMTMSSELSRRQFYERAQEAANRLEGLNAAEWMPIETAPKTGEPIILGYAGSHSSEGFWMGDAGRNHWGETGWFDTDADVLCDHPCSPDAWMPLPPPPTDRRTPEQPT
jgi:hypothetical protein